MATVRLPVFSIDASGAVGVLVFHVKKNRVPKKNAKAITSHVVRIKPRKRSTPPTAAQIVQRARVRGCAQAWANVPQLQRNKWAAKGIIKHFAGGVVTVTSIRHGYALFLREWCIQNSSANNLPMLPA